MTGFFNMEMITVVTKQSSLASAKKIAHTAIDNQPTAKVENAAKARTMIDRSTSINSLAIAMSNFLLANESKSLKVIS